VGDEELRHHELIRSARPSRPSGRFFTLENIMKIKTSELTGAALDIAVAVAKGAKIVKTPESQSWMLQLAS
jgi:hypothetical protein